MKNITGIRIESIREGSPADLSGIMKGDRILSVNDLPARDLIDLMYGFSEDTVTVVIRRDGKRLTAIIERADDGGDMFGITPHHFSVKTCRNKCIFCFVSQLPRGLRKTLYVRDEDYRMSFLYGNYVTLTNLSPGDRKRIVEQRLSPLYLSIHATDAAIRNRMLGNPSAPDVIREIRHFAEHRIRMHAQIVLCPGYNDGIVLDRTLQDLCRFYPYVSSIAVVPVGITVHCRKDLRPVEREDALGAFETIRKYQRRFTRKHGEPLVHASDELYIKADIPFPPVSHYGDFPQIENGVGMVSSFLAEARKIKKPVKPSSVRFVTVTGVSFYPYLLPFADLVRGAGVSLDVVAVGNDFFGRSVTVTGLLTGRDVIRALTGVIRKGDRVLIPAVMIKEGTDIFLDDVSTRDIEDLLGIRVTVIEPTPSGLIAGISELQ